jgi:hypothetical protein
MARHSKMLVVAVGMLTLLLAGGCQKNSTGPQPVRYPTNPVPANGATGQPLHVTLSWQDSGVHDLAQAWDVCFGPYSGPPTVSSAQAARTFDPGTLAAGTTYHWRVVARYANGGQTPGPEWTFTTGSGERRVEAPRWAHGSRK